MIKFENVSKIFKEKENTITALDNINLEIENNSFTMIVGKSGSGKTTLLNLIGLMDKPNSGTIFIDGINYHKESNKNQAIFRQNNIGFVFQDYNLEPHFTIFENMELPLLLINYSKKERNRIIIDMLEKIGLEDRINAKAVNLSGGEQQRIAIARSLLNNPSIILADEPCGNLDEENGKCVLEILNNLHLKDKKTIIMVTHNNKHLSYATHTFHLNKGKIIDE